MPSADNKPNPGAVPEHEAFEELQRRLEQVGREISGDVRRRNPGAGLAPPGDWDMGAAEALMQVYEAPEVEMRAQPARPTGLQPEDANSDPDHQGEDTRDWLEQRFASIAGLIEQSMSESGPQRALSALNNRLDRFEERLETAIDRVAQQPDVGALNLIETHVGELARQLEAARNRLARLDSIDEHLRDLSRALVEDDGRAQAGGLSVETLTAVIDTAAERAASRVATTTPDRGDEELRERVATLEGLLQDYMQEWRRGGEVSSSALQAIEDTLARIADRVEAIETASAPPSDAESVGLALESERLAEAYAAGAKVLGQGGFGSTLDATDYEPSPPDVAEEAAIASSQVPPPISGAGAEDAPADKPGDTRPQGLDLSDLRASAMRAKLKAQGIFATRPAEQATTEEPAVGQAGRARSKLLPGSGPRFSWVLPAAMTALFGTGYVAADAYLSRIAVAPQAALTAPGPAKAAARVQTDTERSPASREPDAASANHARPEEPVREDAPPTALPTSLPPEAGAAPLAKPGHVLADHAAGLTGADAVLPQEIGTSALRSAAIGGDATAQYEVGSRFAEGKGVPQNAVQAFAWFQRAAMRGHAPAQFRVGVSFERGVGIEVDLERAKVWYRRAAEQGHIRSMHNLAVLTIGPQKTPAAYAAAAEWFALAADRGLTDSQYNLALLHENGLGMRRNVPEAYKWFALASQGGDQQAGSRLETLKPQLSGSELAAAEQSIVRWRPRTGAPKAGN